MGHMCNGISWLILQIEMRYLKDDAPWRWGTWAMEHMDDWAHGHKFLNTAGIFTKTLQHIHMDVFFLNVQ